MSTDESRYLVTGGAGFIGTNFVRMLTSLGADVMVLDALTYAGNAANLHGVIKEDHMRVGSIGDTGTVENLLKEFKPHYIVNFAAESHVDRSVDNPAPFVETNIAGSQALFEAARKYIAAGGALKKLIQISTDEVYGDLQLEFSEPRHCSDALAATLGRPAWFFGSGHFSETTPLCPSSPYSASKASADMMAMAYHRSFGLPVIITRCSNNYGPYQFPEKLIPLMINNMLEHKELPVYGRGLNVRDWIHVDDHCRGIIAAIRHGKTGEVYNFGGYAEMRNIDIVTRLISITSGITGDPAISESLIRHVGDRPGHDMRYAIDASKAMAELGWKPQIHPEEGLHETVRWYLDNRKWTETIVNGEYRDYYKRMYHNR